jgi:glycosyltransferase involved in cell wall biosynthesis
MWLRFSGVTVLRSLHVTDKQKDDFFHKLLWNYGNNGIIATAELIRSQLIELGVDDQKTDVVGEYADPEVFHPDISGKEFRSELGITDSDVLITNIGMIRPDKGQTTILRAVDSVVANHPNVKFLFVGEATKSEFQNAFDTESARVKNQSNVIVSGYRKDIPNVMAASDYITIGSTSVEGQSKIAPQCFAMKKPIISTDAGALKEMIHGSNQELGMLIKPDNSQELTSAILQCLSDGYPYDVNKAYDYFKSALTIESRMLETLSIYSKYTDKRLIN